MITRSPFPLLFAVLALPAAAAEKAAPAQKPLEPHPVVKSFYVTGITTEADAAKVADAVRKLPSVTDVKELTAKSGYIRVAFDTHAIASHLIAQTIRNQGAENVYITFTVPDYTANADKLDALFAKVAKERFVKIEAQDKAKGVFKLTYLPITPDPSDPRKVGFNYGHLGHTVHDPPPRGLGLTFIQQDVPVPGAPAAKGKAKGKK
jgi:hypothetical protein